MRSTSLQDTFTRGKFCPTKGGGRPEDHRRCARVPRRRRAQHPQGRVSTGDAPCGEGERKLRRQRRWRDRQRRGGPWREKTPEWRCSVRGRGKKTATTTTMEGQAAPRRTLA